MADRTINLADATRIRDHLVIRHKADLAAARRIRLSSLALWGVLGLVAGWAVGLLTADRVLPVPAAVVEVCDGR